MNKSVVCLASALLLSNLIACQSFDKRSVRASMGAPESAQWEKINIPYVVIKSKQQKRKKEG